MTNIYFHDNRYAPGSSGGDRGMLPLGAPAAYAARWIDHGTWAEVLPDRQGFAYNDPADRDVLIGYLTEAGLAKKLPNIPYDETRLVIDDPSDPGWVLTMRRAGGYVYVDAWLVPEHLVEVEVDDDATIATNVSEAIHTWAERRTAERQGGVEVEATKTPGWSTWVDGVPVDWPVQPLGVGDPMTDTTATCGTCGTCGRSWDDSVSTSMTPTPSGRCPFESFHDVWVDQDGDDVEVDPDALADWQYEVSNGDTLLGFVEWREVNR